MKRALFVFDRVTHYHKDLFRSLACELPRAGWELRLLSGASPVGRTGRVGLDERVIPNEVKYDFRERAVGRYVVRTAHGLAAGVRAASPDVVICMAHVGSLAHWRLALGKSAGRYRLFAWQCGYEYNPGRLKAWMLRRFIPRFDHHLAYHTNARQYALAHGARPDQITVVHNTINEAAIALLSHEEARAKVCQRHPEIANRRIVLFVGALLEEKRVEVVLDAVRLMSREDVVFVIVGGGPHSTALRRRAAGRTDVIFTGPVIEGVGAYFDAAEVYVLPGTGGLGINEAMAHALPVVTGYADGSADDLIHDGENGLRLRAGTPTEVAQQLATVLDNPRLREQMGALSREWITTKYSFRAFVSRVASAITASAGGGS